MGQGGGAEKEGDWRERKQTGREERGTWQLGEWRRGRDGERVGREEGNDLMGKDPEEAHLELEALLDLFLNRERGAVNIDEDKGSMVRQNGAALGVKGLVVYLLLPPPSGPFPVLVTVCGLSNRRAKECGGICQWTSEGSAGSETDKTQRRGQGWIAGV